MVLFIKSLTLKNPQLLSHFDSNVNKAKTKTEIYQNSCDFGRNFCVQVKTRPLIKRRVEKIFFQGLYKWSL